MAITGIANVLDNKTDSIPLLSVHNPLAFIVEVTYTSSPPDELYIKESVNNKVYLGIPYADVSATKRQFLFKADEIMRGLMDSFDDEGQVSDTNIHMAALTKDVDLIFYDPGITLPGTEGIDQLTITSIFAHASRQFGEDPCMGSIYNNDTETYIGIVGDSCYCYFFNDDITNVITMGGTPLVYVILGITSGLWAKGVVELDNPVLNVTANQNVSILKDSTTNITGLPKPGMSFYAWKLGAVKNTDNPLSLLMDGNKTLYAYFGDTGKTKTTWSATNLIITKDVGITVAYTGGDLVISGTGDFQILDIDLNSVIFKQAAIDFHVDSSGSFVDIKSFDAFDTMTPTFDGTVEATGTQTLSVVNNIFSLNFKIIGTLVAEIVRISEIRLT